MWKSKDDRRKEAAARQARYDALTKDEKIVLAAKRGFNRTRELDKLTSVPRKHRRVRVGGAS